MSRHGGGGYEALDADTTTPRVAWQNEAAGLVVPDGAKESFLEAATELPGTPADSDEIQRRIVEAQRRLDNLMPQTPIAADYDRAVAEARKELGDAIAALDEPEDNGRCLEAVCDNPAHADCGPLVEINEEGRHAHENEDGRCWHEPEGGPEGFLEEINQHAREEVAAWHVCPHGVNLGYPGGRDRMCALCEIE